MEVIYNHASEVLMSSRKTCSMRHTKMSIFFYNATPDLNLYIEFPQELCQKKKKAYRIFVRVSPLYFEVYARLY